MQMEIIYWELKRGDAAGFLNATELHIQLHFKKAER